jgi:hypothetical protein
MATNPNVPQGTLNRLRAGVSITDNPSLNVTSPFTGKAGISIAFDGKSTDQIGTMTGIVNAQEPYIMATVTINLLRTQSLGALWKAQMETDSQLGDVVVKADAAQIGTWQLSNCSIETVKEMPMNGTDAGYVVTMTGVYFINNNLWNLN